MVLLADLCNASAAGRATDELRSAEHLAKVMSGGLARLSDGRGRGALQAAAVMVDRIDDNATVEIAATGAQREEAEERRRLANLACGRAAEMAGRRVHGSTIAGRRRRARMVNLAILTRQLTRPGGTNQV